MKVSEITFSDICRQIREEEAYVTEESRKHLSILQKAAMDYVKGYTGLDEAAIDTHEDITIAVLVLISDMYDNRQMTVDKNNVNRVVDTILGMYCVNLL
ncbi:head-tail connector protein [Enterocloster bolteae]|uniref:head-tail connector protein n=1 Tax=Enterocloster bolteae TaxID=208479 RepID=UPI002A814D2A|nr:head-tail connector protein [Enterocloster bolteae]